MSVRPDISAIECREWWLVIDDVMIMTAIRSCASFKSHNRRFSISTALLLREFCHVVVTLSPANVDSNVSTMSRRTIYYKRRSGRTISICNSMFRFECFRYADSPHKHMSHSPVATSRNCSNWHCAMITTKLVNSWYGHGNVAGSRVTICVCHLWLGCRVGNHFALNLYLSTNRFKCSERNHNNSDAQMNKKFILIDDFNLLQTHTGQLITGCIRYESNQWGKIAPMFNVYCALARSVYCLFNTRCVCGALWSERTDMWGWSLLHFTETIIVSCFVHTAEK